jgi:Na+/proline symporter
LLFAILLAATSTLLYFNLPHHLVNYNWQLIVLGAYFGIVASLYLKRDLYRLTMHQALISYVVGVATCALVFYLIPYNFLKGFLLTATSVYFIPYIVSEKLKLVGKAPRPKAKAKKVKAKK